MTPIREMPVGKAPFPKGAGEVTRAWWPMCAKCNKPVERLVVHDVNGITGEAVKRYTVHCHGESEESIVGIWAAFEIAQNHSQLPDAFKTA